MPMIVMEQDDFLKRLRAAYEDGFDDGAKNPDERYEVTDADWRDSVTLSNAEDDIRQTQAHRTVTGKVLR